MSRKESVLFIIPLAVLISSCNKDFRIGVGPSFTGNGSVYGKALLNGQTDHSGVVVSLTNTPLTAETSSDGSYRIDGLAVGTYILTANKTGFGSGNIENVVVTGAGVAYHVPDIVITFNNASLSGIVKNSSLEPIQDANVKLEGANSIPSAVYTNTNVSGGFLFSGMINREYCITISKSGFMQYSTLLPVNSPGHILLPETILFRVDQGFNDSVYLSPGGSINKTWVAQSFIPQSNNIKKVLFHMADRQYFKRMQIRADDNGMPSPIILGETNDIKEYVINSTMRPSEAIFEQAITLQTGIKHWLVIEVVLEHNVTGSVFNYPNGKYVLSNNGVDFEQISGDGDILFTTLY